MLPHHGCLLCFGMGLISFEFLGWLALYSFDVHSNLVVELRKRSASLFWKCSIYG